MTTIKADRGTEANRKYHKEKKWGVSESELIVLLCGGNYNFKHQPERLKYIGKNNDWYQFEKVGEQGVWCELLDGDLHMIEETIEEIQE